MAAEELALGSESVESCGLGLLGSRSSKRVVALFGSGAAGFAALFWLSQANYLLYHSVIEGLSVAVSATVFTLGWTTRRIVRSDMLIVLALLAGKGAAAPEGPRAPARIEACRRPRRPHLWETPVGCARSS